MSEHPEELVMLVMMLALVPLALGAVLGAAAVIHILLVAGAVLLGTVLCAGLGVLGLRAATTIGARRGARRADQAADRSAAGHRAASWAQAVAAHDAIADAYATLRLDPGAALDHLALWDVLDPLTARFTLAYARATDLRSLHGAAVPSDAALVEEYADAVREARVTWDAAVEHAARLGLDAAPAPERAATERARKLLATAADKGAADAERVLAAERAHQLLDTLRGVALPREARGQLAHSARRQLAT